MELCPELVAKPTKDKPATKLVCNFQQQVCLLIRGWSLHATLSLFRLPVQMDESTHSGGFDQQPATLARVRVQQAAGGKTQRSGAHSSEGAVLHYHRQPDCLTHGVQNGCKTECILGTQVKRILWSVETVLRD